MCNSVLHSQARTSDTLSMRKSDNGTIRFAKFSTDNRSSERRIENDVTFLRTTLNARVEDDFKLIRTNFDDRIGITTNRYQQYYKGVKVENAIYLLHSRRCGAIEVMNGNFIKDINIPTVVPPLNEKQALSIALDYVGAERYRWEFPEAEKFIKWQRNNPDATYFPKGELLTKRNSINILMNDNYFVEFYYICNIKMFL
jgi:Zn-dependent metalloprotease